MTEDAPRQPDDDADLVAAAIEELPYVTRALQSLLSRYHGMLYQFCLGYLRDPTEAEDACQIVMLKVFNGLPGFQGQASFKTWLLRIAMNTCYTRKLKMTRERERALPIEAVSLATPEKNGIPGDKAFAGDRFDHMIGRLSAAEQQLLNLRFVADLTLEEIAEVMSIGVSAAKMRYYRALDRLSAQLEEQ